MGHDEKDIRAPDERVEVASLSDRQGLAAMETGYYLGATKKTNPTEIALVCKLDVQIIVDSMRHTILQLLTHISQF